MFQKVLIADDLGSINKGVASLLEGLSIPYVDIVHYCDDAYLKLKKEHNSDFPYQLFITDLSFETDYREQRFTSGDALVKKLKQELPDLKIIVFSVDDRLQKVRNLIIQHDLNGYVSKGRKGLSELQEAVTAVFENKLYVSPQFGHALKFKSDIEISDYHITLLKQLSYGISQEQISQRFKEQNISPSSISAIEKQLNRLKIQFNANNAIHLVSITKDLGLI